MGDRQLFCRHVLLPQGWADDVQLLLDEHGAITEVRTESADPGVTLLEGPVIPGMPNLHSHGFQALIAGLTGRRAGRSDSFWTWREAMYAAAATLGPDELEQCMAGLYLRMLRAGFTACGEFHYLHHALGGESYANPAELSERVMAAAQASGIALTLLPVLYCRSGFEDGPATPAQRRFINDADAFQALLERCDEAARGQQLLRIGLAPHSLRAVDPVTLSEVLAATSERRPVHMHVAEQPAEVEECLTHLGQRPVDWLLDQHGLAPNWCLVHATHTLPGERARAARAGAVAGLCPITEADLGDGIFDAAHWVGSGGSFGIGSDSNLRLTVAGELRLLEFTQRLASGRRNVLADEDRSCGRFLYEAALAGGARALGQAVGRIETGHRADLVELEPGDPALAGLHGDDLLDSYIFTGGEHMIRSVWVGGDCLISQGRHAHGDRLEAGFARVMRQVRSRMAGG